MEPVTHTLPGSQRGPPTAHVRQPIHLSAHEGADIYCARRNPHTSDHTWANCEDEQPATCLTSVSYLDTHLASLDDDDVACVMRARSQLQHLHKGFCRSGRGTGEDGLREEEEGAVLTLPLPFAKRAGRRQLFAGSCSKKMPFSAEICPVHLRFYTSLFHFTPFRDIP